MKAPCAMNLRQCSDGVATAGDRALRFSLGCGAKLLLGANCPTPSQN
jgi:hypothetical protein